MTEPYTPSVKGAREDLRDWLRRYRTARNRKRDLDNRLKNVLADLNDPPLGGQGGGSPGSGTPSAGAAAIAYKIDEVEQRIKDQQGRMAQIFLETSEVIDLLPDIEDRQLLEKRYIDCQGWQQIEKDLYLARSNLARREAKALDTLLQHKTVQEKLAAWLDGPNRVADVIITGASYGNEFDLLEMKGLVSETAEPEELTTGNIDGYMTAERCFRRIRYHWDTHGGKEATGNA